MIRIAPRVVVAVRRARLCLLLVVVFGALPACRSSEQSGGPPVARPSLTLSRDRVAIGSPVKITYRWQVAQDARFDGDYTAFVHVLNPDEEQLWTDDHHPPKPTSQWKPGETVEYTRTVFAPNYPYVGEATIRVGLYQGDKRLVLAGTEASRREYVVGTFQIVPQSENIFLVDKSGWHPAEVAPDNPSSEWRWTDRRAVLSFRNPKKEATFYLEYDARVDLFTPPQQVTIRLGDQVVGSFAATSKVKTLEMFPITAAQLGPGDIAELAIEVDRTFKPGGGDPRELGIRVFHTFVEPK